MECLLIGDFGDKEQTALERDFDVIIMHGDGSVIKGQIGQEDINVLEQSMEYPLVFAYLEK